MTGTNMIIFTDLGCSGAGPMNRSNTGIGWDWECSIGGGYITVVRILDENMEVSEGSVSFSGGNGYSLFVNSVL